MKLFAIHTLFTIVGVYILLKVLTVLPYNALTAMLTFIVVFSLLWLFTYLIDKKYFAKVPKAINLILYFFKELVVASLKIAYEVITPRNHMQPGVIALPLDAKTDFEITLLANLISLTPGTLSLDVSEDRKTLYVHALYVLNGDTEALKKEIKEGFEKKLLELTR